MRSVSRREAGTQYKRGTVQAHWGPQVAANRLIEQRLPPSLACA